MTTPRVAAVAMVAALGLATLAAVLAGPLTNTASAHTGTGALDGPASPLRTLMPSGDLPRDGSSLVEGLVQDAPGATVVQATPWPAGHAAPTLATSLSYSIELECPESSNFRDSPLFGENCPFRVIDQDDIMGNPALVVDPLVPERMVFVALHGTDADGPTNLSRGGLTHTTHTSLNGGVFWRDQPYSASNFGEGGDWRGEDVHAVLDADGNIHVASLFAQPDGRTMLVDWKFDAALMESLQYDNPAEIFDAVLPDGIIQTMWLVHSPEVRNVSLLWRESAPMPPAMPSSPSNGTGNGTGNGTAGNDTAGNDTEASSEQADGRFLWVTGAVTPADPSSPWEPFPYRMTVGPCTATTNPVAHRDHIYVGCAAAAGHPLLGDAAPGTILLHALDLRNLTLHLVGASPLQGGKPLLSIAPSGHVALVTVEPVGNSSVRAEFTTSLLQARNTSAGLLGTLTDADWTPVVAFGDRIHNTSQSIRDARAQAVLFREPSKTIHVIYLEEAAEQEIPPNLFRDPASLVGAQEPQWRKAMLVLDPQGNLLARMDLRISDKGEVFGLTSPPRTADVYGDTRDTLLEVNGREFLAFADYGVVAFAEVIEVDLREEVTPFAQTTTLPPPQPVPAVEPVVLTSGAVFGVAAVAGVASARMLSERMAARSGAGRGRR